MIDRELHFLFLAGWLHSSLQKDLLFVADSEAVPTYIPQREEKKNCFPL